MKLHIPLRKRLAGVFRTAVVWGAAWFTLAFGVAFVLRLSDGVSLALSIADALFMAARVGIIGGLAGGAFAAAIALFYRGRRLADLNWVRFGIGGGILAGLFVPGFLLTGNLLSGDGFPAMTHILDDAIYATLFGAIAAGGSLWLAQRAEDRLPFADEQPLPEIERADPLPVAGENASAQRTRAAR